MSKNNDIDSVLPALERMVPERDKGAAFFYEHILRYLFASQFVREKVALDAGCGSGYGSYILASVGGAKKVFGVDKSTEAIQNALNKYKDEKLNYTQGDVTDLFGISDASIDIAVSFEVLEHLVKQNKFIEQIKRKLKDNGIFIVSTPNIKNYPTGNQFHAKELNKQEFKSLLKKYFKNIRFLDQDIEFSQTIRENIENNEKFVLEEEFSKGVTQIYYPKTNSDNSEYFIAICSNSKIPDFDSTVMSAYSIDNFDIRERNRLLEQLNMTEKKLLETIQKLAIAEQELNYIKFSDYFRLWPFYESFKKNIIKIQKMFLLDKDLSNQRNVYTQYFKNNYPNKSLLKSQSLESNQFKFRPKISLIIPTFNTPERYLRDCIESVLNQSYNNFEICISDDASLKTSVRKIIKEYSEKDSRIKYIFRKENGHISKASNSAISLATGRFIGLLDHDDILWPNALFEIVKSINQNPKIQFLYSDEDKLEEDGITHSDPFFKPDWSPDYLRSINYITHFCVIEKSLIDTVRGFRVGFEGAQDWDLFLRTTNLIKNSKNIFHIPKILYSWRKSDTSTASEKNGLTVKSYAYSNQKRVLESDLQSRGIDGWVEATNGLGSWRVCYKIKNNPRVSIIIPTKDKYSYIARCLNSIINKSTYKNYELIIVDTGSTDENVERLYQRIKDKHSQMKVISWGKEFNFSSVCNFGASKARGEYLIFLNNDTEVLTPDWIEGLLEHGQRSETGAVGCMLLYPDESIQHLGGILGIKGSLDPKVIGVAGHAYRGMVLKDFDRFDKGSVKNYSFVTAACFLISKKKFQKIGGFDPKFKIAFNDVDFCLRVHFNFGLYNLINPFVSLIHHESVSVAKPGQKGRNVKLMKKEISLFVKKWGKIKDNDPFYNPNLTKTKEDFSIDI